MARQPEPTASADEDLAFEDILDRLERVVASLEQPDMPLEQALASFEQGVTLSRLGARRLEEAERRIEVLLRDGNGTRTRPLEQESSDG